MPRQASFAVGGALATLAVLAAFPSLRAPRSYLTTTGHPKAQGELAFMLHVGLKFRDAQAAETLLAAWGEAAAWCVKNEPFLYAYEIAQSDKDPLSYVILERYRSRDDYLGAHRRSPAFKAFRPKMRALQDSGGVTVTGGSFNELGLGFT